MRLEPPAPNCFLADVSIRYCWSRSEASEISRWIILAIKFCSSAKSSASWMAATWSGWSTMSGANMARMASTYKPAKLQKTSNYRIIFSIVEHYSILIERVEQLLINQRRIWFVSRHFTGWIIISWLVTWIQIWNTDLLLSRQGCFTF